ncbi:MAG: hypothetical protein K2G13_07880 [Muribaculaceae bacterium]|nr:hypothetical protein [Muribaculaceae bacterium]
MDSTKPQPFTVSRNIILKTLLLSPPTGWPIWLAFIIGFVLVLIGCFCDVRCLIIGLIIWLTVIPSMTFFMFVNYMFASEMVANLLNHTIEPRPNGYVVHIFRPADPHNSTEQGETWIESGRLSIFDYNIVKRKLSGDYEVLFLKDAPLGILFVPRY